MKKKLPVVLTVVLLAVVIVVFGTHIFTKRSGGPGRAIDSAESVDEATPEPHQMKESLSQTSTNGIEASISAEPSKPVMSAETADITEEKKMDVVSEEEQVQDKQESVAKDVLDFQNEEKESPESETVIKDDQARAIAREAIGDIEFDEKGEIRVERLEGKIRVVFPINMETPPGTRYRGPDYAAEVLIDAQSGEVLRALGGS